MVLSTADGEGEESCSLGKTAGPGQEEGGGGSREREE